MIRVVFVITDLELGGTPLVLRDLVLGLVEGGEILPVVVSLKRLPVGEGTIAGEMEAGGVRVVSLGMRGMRDLVGGCKGLMKVIEEVGADVVYSMLVHANVVATIVRPFLKRRVQFVQSIHTLQEKPGWHWWVSGMAAGFADAIVAPAEAILEKLEGYGSFGRGVVIENGIDVERFAGARAMEGMPWAKGSKVVGYVGRFDPVKNLPWLMEAFSVLIRRVEGMQLALVGYGEQEGELRELGKTLHIEPQMHFLGATREPERFYKVFDVLCLPSEVEGFGLPLVGGMAAGVPVLGVRTGVTEGIVREKAGKLVERGASAETLALALQEVIAPYEKRVSFFALLEGFKGRFSKGVMVSRHEKFFKNILGSDE